MATVNDIRNDQKQPTTNCNTAHNNVIHRLDKLIEPKLAFIGARYGTSFHTLHCILYSTKIHHASH
jgi:hypothetical protein